jgi:hypothetical protein
MKRFIITLGAALLVAVPATMGLIGNTSFAQHVPVRVPAHATLLDDSHGQREVNNPRSGDDTVSDDKGGHPATRTEPGDDNSGQRTTRTEPGDDKGGQRATTSTSSGPGDDKGGQRATTSTSSGPGNDNGGQRTTTTSTSSGPGNDNGGQRTTTSNSGSGKASPSDSSAKGDNGGHGSFGGGTGGKDDGSGHK